MKTNQEAMEQLRREAYFWRRIYEDVISKVVAEILARPGSVTVGKRD